MYNLILPREAEKTLKQCGSYVVDDSEIFVYSQKGEEEVVQAKCADAEESYARQVLNWPRGRLAKPKIFHEPVAAPGGMEACVEHFFHHVGALLECRPGERARELEVYPFAFVVFDQDGPPDQVKVVVALNSEDDQWSLDVCKICRPGTTARQPEND